MGATTVLYHYPLYPEDTIHFTAFSSVMYDACVRRPLWRFFNQRSTLVFYLVRLAVSWTHGRCLGRALIVAKCRCEIRGE